MRTLLRAPPYFRRRSVQLPLALVFIIYNVYEISRILHFLSRPTPDISRRRTERVFIASIHWNNEAILRSYWNEAVTKLAVALGPDNVFVSVYESGSWDDSKGALRALDMRLDEHNVRRNITLSDVTHKDEMDASVKEDGWVDTPRDRRELRRIPYLSRLRNVSLEPLLKLHQQGERFDKVLFLNDVVFTTDDVLRLLDTNDGNYAAACSFDFSKPPLLYDTFAIRDVEGHELLTQTWPYFRARETRHALLANRPVPVSSCWNGMVAMPADPFIARNPLQFRGVPDSLALSHLEGSECCLVHVDNPLSTQNRVYVNPDVRVGYSGEAYDKVHPQVTLQSSWNIFKALWRNRIRRWTTTVWIKETIVSRRIAEWKRNGRGREEDGGICLINEMQVLAENGWAHV